MSDSSQSKLILSLYAGSIASVMYGIKTFRKKRRILDTPSNRIATAAQGLAEFEGFAWNSEPLIKNINGQDCCYRKIELQEKVERKNYSSWETRWTSFTGNTFYVVDKTGVALILATNGDINGQQLTERWHSINPDYQNKIVQSVSSSISGFPPGSGWFSRSFRIQETSIPLGSPILCQGSFSTPSEYPQKVFREGMGEFCLFLQQTIRKPIHEMQRLDLDKDGEVSAEETVSAFTQAAQNSLKLYRESSEKIDVTVYGMLTHDLSHPLFVENGHQYHALQKIGNKSILFVILGAALASAATLLLLDNF
ncbi:MAG: hypothetical protein H6623_00290 [Bdellovibrionaceae bacterium]|nr:hypothetical protein [Pseudobdellovibrionaceae bacterium]